VITDDQLVALLIDAHTTRHDPEFGSSYHQTDRFDVEIENGIIKVGTGGGDFYAVTLDLEQFRAGVEALIRSD
jgi:hypothetical protein